MDMGSTNQDHGVTAGSECEGAARQALGLRRLLPGPEASAGPVQRGTFLPGTLGRRRQRRGSLLMGVSTYRLSVGFGRSMPRALNVLSREPDRADGPLLQRHRLDSPLQHELARFEAVHAVDLERREDVRPELLGSAMQRRRRVADGRRRPGRGLLRSGDAARVIT